MEKKDCVKLPGAKFVLLNENCQEIACGVTDKCGKIIFDCLPFGKYFLKELEAPCGYVASEELCPVEINCKNCHGCVDVINPQKKGDICVTLLGKDYNCCFSK